MIDHLTLQMHHIFENKSQIASKIFLDWLVSTYINRLGVWLLMTIKGQLLGFAYDFGITVNCNIIGIEILIKLHFCSGWYKILCKLQAAMIVFKISMY
jgi:hypothetical protein